MKKKSLNILLLAVGMLLLATSAHALSLSYEFAGVTYGTMDISAPDAETLRIDFTAGSPLPGNAEITGFGFTFADTTLPTGVSNPADALFANDRNDLNWIELTNLNAIPNAANSSLTKSDFLYGVTEGNANTLNPPGLLAGEFDVFYLDFSGITTDLSTLDLADFVVHTGIRVQSLPDDINGGSLFLTDRRTVPEPATMLLFGTGLIGLAAIGRKKYRKR